MCKTTLAYICIHIYIYIYVYFYFELFDTVELGCEQVELIDPAVVGTLNVLNSCAKAKSVRRVVLTSSTAAIRFRADLDNITTPLDDSVWSDLQFCAKYKVHVIFEPRLNALVTNST